MIPLQSGSNGNSIYVESREVRLLFDCGISAQRTAERLEKHSLAAAGINGLFVSHDHSDHISGVGVVTRKFGVPLFATSKTFTAAKRRMGFSDHKDLELQHFRAGDSVKVGHVTVETLSTPHDAVDGVVFIVDDGKSRLGICTDFGHVFSELENLVSSVDAMYLESNYDDHMLMHGSYPFPLKRRISGPGGHISNKESALLIAEHAGSRLQWLCLAHLSASNNAPNLALAAHREVLGDTLPITVAQRYDVSAAHIVETSAVTPSLADLVFERSSPVGKMKKNGNPAPESCPLLF